MPHDFISALAGGLLIGAAAAALLLLLGRIAGISGILWGALANPGDRAWRWLFVAGLVLGTQAWHLASGTPVPAPSAAGPFWAIGAGLLVGIGVKLGSGCTSGHGVCGLGRLSTRSLAATITFMATGIASVAALRALTGLPL